MSERSSLIGQHFAYASGRIGVLQQLLLTQSDIDRLLGANDKREAEKILTELKLTSAIDQSLSTTDDILHAVGQWIRHEVEQMSPEAKQPVFSILWLAGDAPILSYLLKKKHHLTSEISQEPLDASTAYNPEALRLLIEEGIEGMLPSHLVQFVKDSLQMESPSAKQIDAAVAQFVADTQLKLVRTSGSSVIKKYVTHRIDLQNIRTAMRLQDGDTAQEMMIKGGSIAIKDLDGDPVQLSKVVSRSGLPYHLAESIANVREDKMAFEKSVSEVIAADIAEMWNVPLSIEPLFAFAAIALSHLKLLRVLLIGKSNELSPQDIKKMIPPFVPSTHYVL